MQQIYCFYIPELPFVSYIHELYNKAQDISTIFEISLLNFIVLINQKIIRRV